MNDTRSIKQETAEDIFFGQVVMNWARWFLIAGALILVVWKAADTNELIVGTLAVVALMAVNFYLHGRHLAQRPANPSLITIASLMDLAVITLVVLIWPEPEQRGLGSPFFVMYYPLVLAFAFVMRPSLTVVYTAVALSAYTGASLLAGTDQFDLETLVARLIALGAMGGLGTYYWRIQRDRLGRATEGPAAVSGTQPGV